MFAPQHYNKFRQLFIDKVYARTYEQISEVQFWLYEIPLFPDLYSVASETGLKSGLGTELQPFMNK